MNTARIVAAICLGALVASCSPDAPEISSGFVARGYSDEVIRPLSKEEVAGLNSWLNRNRGGWSRNPASYVPGTVVRVRGVDGSSWTLNVLDRVVVLNSGNSQFTLQAEGRPRQVLQRDMGLKHDG